MTSEPSEPISDRNRLDAVAAVEYLTRANELRNANSKEEVMKANLFHHLPSMFPDRPGWLDHHISGAEAHLKIVQGEAGLSRFTDSLIGLTSIEYEPDLRRAPRFAGGLHQVKEHLAGLLNQGHPVANLVGILSDAVLWIAYAPSIETEREVGRYGTADIELHEIDKVDASAATEANALDLGEFLVKYLGRSESRPLTAQTIVADLGIDSRFGSDHMTATNDFIDAAFAADPAYAELIESLWVRFVAVAGSGAATVPFDGDNYSHEVYLVTLSKLICANVLAGRALRSDEGELERILSGEHFRSEGLDNLVEYDYFGWLADGPNVAGLLPIAQAVQEDLHAYDFTQVPVEDLFGQLMAELGRRSQRLLLGQEFTPSWLCDAMAQQLLADLPDDAAPRFVDMCCGSGAMLVSVTREYAAAMVADGTTPGDPAALERLLASATGFDIDPLAVLLAKVNWVVANREWLAPGQAVSIPVYHADSLFTGVPFAHGTGDGDDLRLSLHEGVEVTMPVFLIDPDYRQLFDDLLHRAYALARSAEGRALDARAVASSAAAALSDADLDPEDTARVTDFFRQLVDGMHQLQAAGLNGLWAFILKNSYRPALVAGQFNGLISNPPWLALSKIGNNPYGVVLRALANRLKLNPPGAAHLHTELSTTFLYASIDRYLQPNAVVACILPDAVLNGYQHRPFREGAPATTRTPIRFRPDHIWRIARHTFKNEAIVVFGTKAATSAATSISGQIVSRNDETEIDFAIIRRGNRLVWSDTDPGSHGTDFLNAGEFRQGADLMPRTLLFHDLQPTGSGRWNVGAIDRHASPKRYLVKDAKKLKEFSVSRGSVEDRFVYKALLSNHLTPFGLADPAEVTLPFERTPAGWVAVPTQEIAADPPSADFFKRIHAAISPTADSEALLRLVETDRSKLSEQIFPAAAHLVVFGAGGGVACAASRPLAGLNPTKLVIDQTLYWLVVDTEDEALYLTGLFNSPAIIPVIAAFQPQGQQKERHVHTLPKLVTPRFDPADPLHQEVVTQTAALLAEWQGQVTTAAIGERLDPNKALASRRTFLRGKIAELPAFSDYAEACEALYDSTTE
jgi:hypothetical protein